MKKKISIVIPVYFNQATLWLLYERLSKLADQRTEFDYEFIFVDDGSGDQSYARMEEIAGQDKRVKCIKLVRNFGSNTAILAGLTYSTGDCAGFIAADLQDPPETLFEMVDAWQKGGKVILAVRKDRLGDPFFTRVFANAFNRLFNKLVYPGYSPQGVGFFLIDRQVVEILVECKEKNAHLIGLLFWMGFPAEKVFYERKEREHGKSRWTFQKKIKYFIDAFAGFSYLPLRLATFMGLLFAAIGSIYAVVLVMLKLFNLLPPVQGWTALMVVVLILSGVQLIILGIIGEYLWRNFDATRKRPLFIVDCVVDHNQPDTDETERE